MSHAIGQLTAVQLWARAGDGLVLIAAGGSKPPDDAWARLRAGATLVQAYTGFIYGGPLWPRRRHAGLARRAGPPGPGLRALVDHACFGERQRLP